MQIFGTYIINNQLIKESNRVFRQIDFPTLCVRAGFWSTKLSTYHQSPIGKLNLNVSTPPRMTQNVCYAFALLFQSLYALWCQSIVAVGQAYSFASFGQCLGVCGL